MDVADQLDELGYTIMEASDAAIALKLLGPSQKINLLLTDVGLPGGMNGRQLADAYGNSAPSCQSSLLPAMRKAQGRTSRQQHARHDEAVPDRKTG